MTNLANNPVWRGVAAFLFMFALPSVALPCSIFSASDDQNVLVGNNEDFPTLGGNDTALWFEPPADGHYGYMLVGYSKFRGARTFSQQGGMNEAGLFIDANAVPWLEARTDPDGARDFFVAGFFGDILRHCATVDEALARLADTNLTGIVEKSKFFIADANGDAAIFEGDCTTRKNGDYLISTNFRESHPEIGGHPCWRWDILDQMMSSGLELTESFFADAADAAHQGTSAESQVITYYTNVCDLKRKQFVLYYLFDFSRPRVFDLAEELELSGGAIPMADLFGEPFSGQRPEIEFHLEQYLPGHRLSVLVRDRFANLDPELRDRLLVTVSGDRETAGELLQLTEIGPNLGVFVGAMSMGLGSPVPGDGVLQVDPGDLITATYNHHLKGGEITEKGERAYTSVYCDLDGDGVDADECGGTDCDDERPDMYPDAQEFCDGDDDDCDTVIDEGCVDCMAPQEPDATADGLAPNPLGCGQCVSGDFDETFYGDQGHYRIWVDAYAIDAEAGQKLISTVHRAVPNGVLQQQLFDPSFAEVLADDELFGVLEHTVEESGTYYLVLLMSRVDHTIEPNAYQLELHCRSVANRVDDNRHSRTSAGPTDIR